MAIFSKAFWVANSVKLLERLAYYAVFIVLTIYLSNVLGFSDTEVGIIAGCFSALLYLLPTFVVSGVLLEKFCPDPKTLPAGTDYALATANAHYIWYVFFCIGLVAAVALIIYSRVERKADAQTT